MLSLALLATLCAAHNWPNGPSRVSLDKVLASTVAPVIKSPNNQPHVVVRAGQKFQFEFVTGHNQDVYLIVLNAKDADKMKLHEVPLMEEFLKSDSCQQSPPSAVWRNYHYKWNTTSLAFQGNKDQAGVLPAPVNNFYKRHVPKSDPNFIPRDPMFKKSLKNKPANGNYNLINQFEYKDTDMVTNRRCAPTKPFAKMNWVLAMHKYRIIRHQPSEPDVMWVEIPAGNPPGDYIVHWRWRGYYDAVDVKVVGGTVDVAQPFGGSGATAAVTTTFKRIDHCVFPGNKPAGNCGKLVAAGGKLPAPTECINACKKMTKAKCDGVAVVPVTNPNTVLAAFRNITTIKFTATTCPKPTDGTTHMCFPLVQAEPTMTEAPYYATNDHEDPAFYGSCFLRVDSVARPGLPDPSTLPPIAFDEPEFLLNGRCVSCADVTKFSAANITPVWTLAEQCVNCDLK